MNAMTRQIQRQHFVRNRDHRGAAVAERHAEELGQVFEQAFGARRVEPCEQRGRGDGDRTRAGAEEVGVRVGESTVVVGVDSGCSAGRGSGPRRRVRDERPDAKASTSKKCGPRQKAGQHAPLYRVR